MSKDEPKPEKPNGHGQSDQYGVPNQPEAGGHGGIENGPGKHGEQHNDGDDDPYASPLEWIQNKLRKPQTLNTMMVIFTGLLVVTSSCQWLKMDETLEKSQRAWLGVDDFEEIQVVIGKPLKATIRINNFGSSPALNVEIAQILRPATPDVTAFDLISQAVADAGPNGSRSVFMPGASSRVICETDDSLTTAEAIKIVNGEKLLRVAGKATYEDIFGEEHTTTFCYWYGPKQQGYNASNEGNTAN